MKTNNDIPDNEIWFIDDKNIVFNKKGEEMEHYGKKAEEYIKISKENWQRVFDSTCPEFREIMKRLVPGKREEKIELKSGQIYKINQTPYKGEYRLLLKVNKEWTTIVLGTHSLGDCGLCKCSEEEMKEAMDYVAYTLCPNARLKVIEEEYL